LQNSRRAGAFFVEDEVIDSRVLHAVVRPLCVVPHDGKPPTSKIWQTSSSPHAYDRLVFATTGKKKKYIYLPTRPFEACVGLLEKEAQ
jgi:hypothetical protein